MKTFIFAFVLVLLAQAERLDPPSTSITPGNNIAGNGAQTNATLADCEQAYFSIAIPNGIQSGFLRVEALQNSTGAVDATLKASVLPTDSNYESSCSLTAEGTKCSLLAFCRFNGGNYFVGVKGKNSTVLTSVAVNATVIDQGEPIVLSPTGSLKVVTDPNRSNTSDTYDFFRVSEPVGVAGSMKIVISAIQANNMSLDVFVERGSQAGPSCSSGGSVLNCMTGYDNCTVEVSICQYTSPDWFITVITRAATSGNSTFTYTISALVSHPTVVPINYSTNMADSVVPGSYNYYRLPVNTTGTQVSVRVDAIMNGALDVNLDYFAPLGGSQCGAGSDKCVGVSAVGNDTICTLTVPFCSTQVGDYYIVVKGVSIPSVPATRPVQYTLEVNTFVPPNNTLVLDVPLSSKVQTDRFDQFILYVPPNTPKDAEIKFQVFVDADQVHQVSITASTEAESLCSGSGPSGTIPVITTGSVTPYKTKFAPVQSCVSRTGNNLNSCTITFNSCDFRSGNWYVKVEGVAPQNTAIGYTIKAYISLPVSLSPSQSIAGSANDAYMHYKLDLPAATVARALIIELDSVDDGSVEVFSQQGKLAGCDSCYTGFDMARIPYAPSGSSVNGGPYTNTPDNRYIPSYLVPASANSYYFSVRGDPDAGKTTVKYSFTVKVVEDAPATVKLGPASAITKSLAVDQLEVFEVTATLSAPLFADVVVNSFQGTSNTKNSMVFVALYNAEFNWSEISMPWATLPDPKVFAASNSCILGSASTTCSVMVPKCSVGKVNWRIAVIPLAGPSSSVGDVLSIGYTLNTRQEPVTVAPINMGSSTTKTGVSPVSTDERSIYYFSFNLPVTNSGQYLEVQLVNVDSTVPMTLYLDSSKVAGPAPCDGSTWTCAAKATCTLVVEPCFLKAGTWYASVAVGGTASAPTAFTFKVSPTIKSAVPLVNGRGEKYTVSDDTVDHHVLSYPTVSNPGAFLWARVVAKSVNPVTLRLARNHLAGCSECLSFATGLTCTTDATNQCLIPVAPCDFVAGDWYAAVSTASPSADYQIVLTVFDVAPKASEFGVPMTGVVNITNYLTFSLPVPQNYINSASMSVVVDSADGIEAFEMYVFPSTSTGGTSLNPDKSACAMATCTQTNATSIGCPSLLFPVNPVTTWIVGVKGLGAKNTFSITAVLNPVRELISGTTIASTLKPSAFEAYYLNIGGAPEAGSYLEVTIAPIQAPSLGVELLINGGSPVRQSYPGSARKLEFLTDAALIRTQGSKCAVSNYTCTTIVKACSFSSSKWYFDVKANGGENNTVYQITAYYRKATGLTATTTSAAGTNVSLGDAAYRTFLNTPTTAAPNGYYSIQVNSTDAGIKTSLGEYSASSPKLCTLSAGTQFGPCCSSGSPVVIEVMGTPTLNNTASFDYLVDYEGPLMVPLNSYDGLVPAGGVRANQYRHFYVDVPASAAGAGQWLKVKSTQFTGTISINPDSPAGLTADGGCLARTMSCQDACEVTVEPCLVAAAGRRFFISAKAGATASPAFNITAFTSTLNVTTITSGADFAGEIQAGEYLEFVYTVPATLGPLATLEFSTLSPPPTAPDAPTGVIASSTAPVSVTVTWTAPVSDGFADITTYEVSMATGPTFANFVPLFSTVGPVTSATLTGANGIPSTATQVAFRVKATNSAGTSLPSSQSVIITTQGAVAPATVSSISVGSPATAKATTVLLSWSAATGGINVTATFYVSRRTDSTGAILAVPTNTTVVIPNAVSPVTLGISDVPSNVPLAENSTYIVRMRLSNTVGSAPADSPDFLFTTGAAGTRRALEAATATAVEVAPASASMETAPAVVTTRRLLAPGDPNFQVTSGLYVRVSGTEHAGASATCQSAIRSPTRRECSSSSNPDTPLTTVGTKFCTILALCDSPAFPGALKLAPGMTVRFMLSSTVRSNYRMQVRLQDPVVASLALDTPTQVMINDGGSAGLTLTPPANAALPPTFSYLSVRITNTTAPAKVSVGSACSGVSTCTVSVGETTCIALVRSCDVAGQASLFVSVSNAAPLSYPVLTASTIAPTQLTVGASLTAQLNATNVVPSKASYYAMLTLTNPSDLVDIEVTNVANGTVKASYRQGGDAVCSAATSCTASSASRTKGCRVPVFPCGTVSGYLGIEVVATSGTPEYTIRVSTRAATTVTYLSPSANDYLDNDQFQQYAYVYNPSANMTVPGGTFLVVTKQISNTVAPGQCTHDVTIAINKNAPAFGQASTCNLATTSIAEGFVDTCTFGPGTWYIGAKGATAPAGVYTPVNYRLTANVYTIPLVPVAQSEIATWVEPYSTFNGHTEFVFEVDSIATSASRLFITFDAPASSGPVTTYTLLVNRGTRMGWITSAANLKTSACLQDDFRFYTSTTCNSGATCTITVESCDLAPGKYYARILSSAASPSGRMGTFAWYQIDSIVKPIASGSEGMIKGALLGGGNHQTYRFVFNNTLSDAVLYARLSLSEFGPSGVAAPQQARLDVRRDNLCNPSSSCSVSTGSPQCFARVELSSSSTASCTSESLVDIWFITVVGLSESAYALYDLEITQKVTITPLTIGEQICPVIREWGIKEYSVPVEPFEARTVSALAIQASSGSGSVDFHYSAGGLLATSCSADVPSETCMQKNGTYIAAIDETNGAAFTLSTIVSRPVVPALILDSSTEVAISLGSNHFSFDVPAGPTALDISQVSFKIANSFPGLTLAVNNGALAFASSCNGGATSCPVSGACTVTLCGALPGTYYVNVESTNSTTVRAVLSPSILPRTLKTIAAGAPADVGSVGANPIVYEVTGVPVGSYFTAQLTSTSASPVTVTLHRNKPVNGNTCAAAKTCTAATGAPCSVAFTGGCDTQTSTVYAVVSSSSGSCVAATYSITFTASQGVIPIQSGVEFTTNSSATIYELPVTGANNSTASLADTYLTILVRNPLKSTGQFKVTRGAISATAGNINAGCTVLPTNRADANGLDLVCSAPVCSYFVLPCDLAAGTGSVYITGGGVQMSVTATFRPLGGITPVPASLAVNSSAIELYAVPPGMMGKLVRLQAAAGGSIRYTVHRTDACTSIARGAFRARLTSDSGLVSIFEHNQALSLSYSELRPTVVIVQDSTLGLGSGYTITSSTGKGACAPYNPLLIPGVSTLPAYCEIPANQMGQDVWSPFSTSKYRDTKARDRAALIESRFLCPSDTECGQCPKVLSDTCRKAIMNYVCAATYRRCDASGYLLGVCRSYVCEAVEKACGRTFKQVGLPRLSCDNDEYVKDGNDPNFSCSRWDTFAVATSPIPSPFTSPMASPTNGTESPEPETKGKKKLSTGAIAGIAVGGAVLVGAAAGAGIVMKGKGGKGGASGPRV